MTSHLLAPGASDETLDGRSEMIPLDVRVPRHEGQGPPAPQRLRGPEVHPGHLTRPLATVC